MRFLAKYLLIIPVLGAICFGMLLGGGAEYVRLATLEENSMIVRIMNESIDELANETII